MIKRITMRRRGTSTKWCRTRAWPDTKSMVWLERCAINAMTTTNVNYSGKNVRSSSIGRRRMKIKSQQIKSSKNEVFLWQLWWISFPPPALLQPVENCISLNFSCICPFCGWFCLPSNRIPYGHGESINNSIWLDFNVVAWHHITPYSICLKCMTNGLNSKNDNLIQFVFIFLLYWLALRQRKQSATVKWYCCILWYGSLFWSVLVMCLLWPQESAEY